MGCGDSHESLLFNVYERNGVGEHRDLFECLSFREQDIGRIHEIYMEIDTDDSGTIDVAELEAYLRLEKTRFTKRIFSIFDEDNSGSVDFREFVLSLYNYCTLTKASLELFAFDLYDKDSSGSMEAAEVQDMLNDLYGRERKKCARKNGHYRTVHGVNPHANLAERELDAMEALDGDVNVDDFKSFIRLHPALLFRAFRIQQCIQDCVLGSRFWAKYTERRIDLSKGRQYVPVSELIGLHVNKRKNKKYAVLNNKAVDPVNSTVTLARRRGSEVQKHKHELSHSSHEHALHVKEKYSEEAGQEAHTYIFRNGPYSLGRKIGCEGPREKGCPFCDLKHGV
jgi:Ca2+-binding EF-hand superfamily protein